jgi:ABC-2 type transport system ATP-binding protein
MDQKLKNYSSGMQVRLAFSIAIRAKSDILLLDEILAVGDEAFQRKCYTYFAELKRNKKTVILVTHGMDNVRKYCNKAMLIRDGEVVAMGKPEDVANEYSLENLGSLIHAKKVREKESVIKNLKVELLSPKQISQNESVKIKVTYETTEKTRSKVTVNLYDVDRDTPVLGSVSPIIDSTRAELMFSVKISELNDTNFMLRATIRNEDDEILAFVADVTSPTFAFRRNDYGKYKTKSTYSLLLSRGEWK